MRERSRLLIPFVAAIVAVPIQFLFPGIGDDVELEFYAATAQVIPVLYLAVLVEVAVRYTNIGQSRATLPEVERRLAVVERQAKEVEHEGGDVLLARVQEISSQADDLRKSIHSESRQVINLVMAYSLAVVVGEAPSLFALAAQESNTFALVLTLGSLVSTFTILTLTFIERFRF